MTEIRIFSGRSHKKLAEEICRQLKIKLSQRETKDYADGCLEVILRDKVKGCKVFLIQTSVPQTLHRDLEELRQMINAAKEKGASEIIVVMPYVSYARSDKKYTSGMAIAARLLIELLKESGMVKVRKAGKVVRVSKMTKFIGIDFHSQKFEKFLSELNVRAYHLYALPLLAKYLKTKNLQNTILLAGDKGARKKARLLAKKLDITTDSVGFVDKTRISDIEVKIENIDIEVAGKDVVVFDDEISPVATTLKALVKELRKRGAKSIEVVVTHASITQDTIRSLQKLGMIRELIVTDTVPILEEARRLLPLRVLSVVGLIAEKIKEISEEPWEKI